MTIALVDADLVAFRCAATCEQESDLLAHLRCDDMMRKILNATGAERYRAFLSGSNNFRKELSSEYKANRKDKIPPQWLQSCREFLVREWGAIVTDGIEADDALGISQTDETIICSIDKDLKQIPGNHYNFVKEEFFEVSILQGLQHFYKQLLIGDTSDNIFGVHGIGPVKADKVITPLTTELDMYNVVKTLYKDDVERLHLNGKLLWILREEGEQWNPEKVINANSIHNSSDSTTNVDSVNVQEQV